MLWMEVAAASPGPEITQPTLNPEVSLTVTVAEPEVMDFAVIGIPALASVSFVQPANALSWIRVNAVGS
jgi:hypothetical protein